MSFQVPVFELSDISEGKIDSNIETIFGKGSAGAIFVKGLPEEYHILRRRVLESSSHLARLPQAELEKLELPEAYWLIGWSKGKEKLVNGEPDDKKGSFYVNCSFYRNKELEGPPADEIPGYEKFTGYITQNVWPEGIEGFKKDLKDLICILINVVVTVAEACDRVFGGVVEGYEPGYLKNIIQNSNTSKSRLLHYFPMTEEEALLEKKKSKRDDSWCGEHFDHSCLTGLTSDMFFDESRYPELTEYKPEPNDPSGLYIRRPDGEVQHINFNNDHMLIQVGSALEELTRGNMKAVSHFVRGSEIPNISRNTLAVFCQMSLADKVGPNYKDYAEYAESVLKSNH